MNKEELQNQFINWIERKTSSEVGIAHPFLLVCLDEEIELNLNSKIDGVPFYQHYSNDELMSQILNGWISTAKSFLRPRESNISIVFRGVPLPDSRNTEVVLSQLSDLVAKLGVNEF